MNLFKNVFLYFNKNNYSYILKELEKTNDYNYISNIIDNCEFMDYDLIKIIINKGYKFKKNQVKKFLNSISDYYSISNIIDNSEDNVIDEELAILAIKLGYRFNENTPDIMKNNTNLFVMVLNNNRYNNYIQDLIDKYVNWDSIDINDEKVREVLTPKLVYEYKFNENTPDKIKNNISLLIEILNETDDIIKAKILVDEYINWNNVDLNDEKVYNILKRLIISGYEFNENTPNSIKSNISLLIEMLNYTFESKKIQDLIDKYVNWDNIDLNDEKINDIFQKLIDVKYEFNENTPNKIKSNINLVTQYVENTVNFEKIQDLVDKYINWDNIDINDEKVKNLLILLFNKGYSSIENMPNKIKNNIELLNFILNNTSNYYLISSTIINNLLPKLDLNDSSVIEFFKKCINKGFMIFDETLKENIKNKQWLKIIIKYNRNDNQLEGLINYVINNNLKIDDEIIILLLNDNYTMSSNFKKKFINYIMSSKSEQSIIELLNFVNNPIVINNFLTSYSWNYVKLQDNEINILLQLINNYFDGNLQLQPNLLELILKNINNVEELFIIFDKLSINNIYYLFDLLDKKKLVINKDAINELIIKTISKCEFDQTFPDKIIMFIKDNISNKEDLFNIILSTKSFKIIDKILNNFELTKEDILNLQNEILSSERIKVNLDLSHNQNDVEFPSKIINELINNIDDEKDLINILDKFNGTKIITKILNTINYNKINLYDSNLSKKLKYIIDSDYEFSDKTPKALIIFLLKEIKSTEIFDLIIDNCFEYYYNDQEIYQLIQKILDQQKYLLKDSTPQVINKDINLLNIILKSDYYSNLVYIVHNIIANADLNDDNIINLYKKCLMLGYKINKDTPKILMDDLSKIKILLENGNYKNNINYIIDNIIVDYDINDNEVYNLIINAINNGYIFNSFTPDSIKGNYELVYYALENSVDINNILLNISDELLKNKNIYELIEKRIDKINLSVLMKIYNKLNEDIISTEVKEVVNNLKIIINSSNKINLLEKNDLVTIEFIKYVYPVFGKDICISLLKYDSGAIEQILNEIKNNDVDLIKYYYQKIVPKIFSINNEKTIHYAFRYFGQFKNIISELYSSGKELNENTLHNLNNIILAGNRFKIDSIEDLENYNKIIVEKYKNLVNTDDINEIRSFIAFVFGFKDSIDENKNNIRLSNYANLKKSFYNNQLDNFSKINFVYESIRKSGIISEEALNSIMLSDNEFKLLLLIKGILETDDLKILKQISSNLFDDINKPIDFSTVFYNIIKKIRILYNYQFQSKMTTFKDLKSKKEIKSRDIMVYDDQNDKIGHKKEVKYEMIYMDGENFNFLGHKIANLNSDFNDLYQMLLKNPSLWTKLYGSSTLSLSTLSNKGINLMLNTDSVVYLFNQIPRNFLLYMYKEDLYSEDGKGKFEPTSMSNLFTDFDALNQQSIDSSYNEVAGFREGMMPCAIACFDDEPTEEEIRAADYFKIPIISFNIKKYVDKCTAEFKSAYDSFQNDISNENIDKIFLSGKFCEVNKPIEDKFYYCFKILKNKLQNKEISVELFIEKISYIQLIIDRLSNNYNLSRIVRKIQLYKETISILYNIDEDKIIDLETANMGETGIMYKYINSEKTYLIKPAVDKVKLKTENFRAEIQAAAAKLQKIISPETSVNVDVVGNNNQKISVQEKIELSNQSDILMNPKITNQLLKEYVIDFALCNFDCYSNNFIIDKNNNLRGVDKEQSFRFINDEETLNPDFSYSPNGLTPIYNILFKKYLNGEIELDFTYFDDAIKSLQEISDNEYKNIFRPYAIELYPENPDAFLNLILDRRNKTIIILKDYIEKIRYKNMGGIKKT